MDKQSKAQNAITAMSRLATAGGQDVHHSTPASWMLLMTCKDGDSIDIE